jgi:hypothetical protein
MDRMTQLEDAHRALAAQNTALMEFVRAILPLIPLPADQLQQALVRVYDSSNAHMDDAVMDVEYQGEVRKWLDVLSDAASAGCKSPGQRKGGA